MRPISFKRLRFPADVIRHAAAYNTFKTQPHLIPDPAFEPCGPRPIRRVRPQACPQGQ